MVYFDAAHLAGAGDTDRGVLARFRNSKRVTAAFRPPGRASGRENKRKRVDGRLDRRRVFFLGARLFGIFSGSRHLRLDIRRFPTILLQTITLGNGMLKEASRNRASGVNALGLRIAPLRRQRQPGTARTLLASDFAIPGVNGGFARPSPAWGRACAVSSRGTRNRAVGRTYAATGQSRRQDILGGLVKRLRNLEPEFRKVMRRRPAGWSPKLSAIGPQR